MDKAPKFFGKLAFFFAVEAANFTTRAPKPHNPPKQPQNSRLVYTKKFPVINQEPFKNSEHQGPIFIGLISLTAEY
ncbi:MULTISPECIES: hypothetical protein [unclassified Fibrobacter]|uniref:hypothetical protein n=1 Tax=unclassified Fibrobacter TaxID=2634177 RepID=UPI000932ECF3|nr:MULTISPECIES: hypothetical protein [unclassified Fibrobacter]MDO4946108.1 hypothetical protein [Fibrobacter sp.]OWV04777.1 hypothetical protein B7993_10230 [Fibrobacter sp. UWH3]OWV13845.1 hypothetical protein B7992_07740 [Fibrobacter sp. UWH1]